MVDNAPQTGLTAGHWKDAIGETWARLAPLMERINLPVWQAIVERAGPATGELVLDVGCGAGATTLDMARRVAPGGRCVGLDISPPLLAAARRAAEGEGVAEAQFIEADAETHAFDAEAFDAVVSRYGVMFFGDPDAAFANLRTALRPDGWLVFVCWRSAADNPLSLVPLQATAHLLPPRPAPPADAPGRFAFADPERVRGILARSGWRDIEITPLDADTPVTFDEMMALSIDLGALAPLLRDQPQALKEQARNAVAEALRPYAEDGVIPLKAACWLVAARPEGRVQQRRL